MVLQSGGWPAPFGISIVIDLFSAFMLLVTGFMGLSVAIYSISQVDKDRLQSRFFVFYMGVLMGVNGAFTTGDIFNLYVWFEVMLLSSFVLITLGNQKEQLQGAIKYVTMSLVGSLFFLAGIGLLYGKTGTLNLANLAQILRSDEESFLINTSAMLFFLAFGIKSAVFPLFFWLPASYHLPPVSVTAFFAGLLTKVGVYSMIRFFTLFYYRDISFLKDLLLVIAGFTMVVGVLSAASEYGMRKILSFHIISQIGYMIMGLGFFTIAGIGGAIYFIVHNILSKTAAFLSSGIVHRMTGSYDLKSIGGIYKKYPLISLLFAIPALSLAGIPPLSGFVGKFYLILAGFEARQYLITAIAIVVSLFTLFSMMKIWNEVFWKPSPKKIEEGVEVKKIPPGMSIPLLFMVLAIIVMGVMGGFFMDISTRAAEQILNPDVYIDRVLSN
jgi:multicomponent Na+:H+ antiporter subunit D